MEPMEVLGVEHIDLTVTDMKRSAIFYDKVLRVLGFKRLTDADDDGHDARWGNAFMTIGIRPAAASSKSEAVDRYRVGFHHLALKAKTRTSIDGFHNFLMKEKLTVLDAPAEHPQYGENYYAVFFADPDGMKLELVHFPWGYWRRVQRDGSDPRPRS